jgi:hypothetical protein
MAVLLNKSKKTIQAKRKNCLFLRKLKSQVKTKANEGRRFISVMEQKHPPLVVNIKP